MHLKLLRPSSMCCDALWQEPMLWVTLSVYWNEYPF